MKLELPELESPGLPALADQDVEIPTDRTDVGVDRLSAAAVPRGASAPPLDPADTLAADESPVLESLSPREVDMDLAARVGSRDSITDEPELSIAMEETESPAGQQRTPRSRVARPVLKLDPGSTQASISVPVMAEDPAPTPATVEPPVEAPAAGPMFGEIKGTVTLDGEELPGARITFVPVDGAEENEDQRKSMAALTNQLGQYSITRQNTRDGNGLETGKYKIIVTTTKISPDVNVIDRLEIVPAKYNRETTLEVVVEANQLTGLDLPLKSTVR